MRGHREEQQVEISTQVSRCNVPCLPRLDRSITNLTAHHVNSRLPGLRRCTRTALKIKLEGKLNQARIVHRSCNRSKVGRIHVLTGLEELRMIKDIEELCPEIQLHTLTEWQPEVFDRREIRVHEPRAVQRSPVGVPEFARRWVDKTLCVEPLRNTRVAQVTATNLVRTVDRAGEAYS